MSIKFDKLDREEYRLFDAEIRACMDPLSDRDLKDIEFAQEQVRKFAQHQKAALQDLEVETLPLRLALPQERAGELRRLLRAGR